MASTPILPRALARFPSAMDPNSSSSSNASSLKLAIALALLRYNKLHHLPPSPSSISDAQRWKRKAKERKRELLRLREELKQLEDGMREDFLPQIAACRCHFFDGCGKLSPRLVRGGGEGHWIDEVLRRRFLRLVRWKERRKRLDGFIPRRHYIEFNNEDEIERLNTSIDFLVEISTSLLVQKDSSFTTLSHQAIDFILASLKNLLSSQKDSELIEEMVDGLIFRLTRRMCTITEDEGSLTTCSDAQFYVQHLIRKLGNEPFIGQRIMLSVSQKISIDVESLLLMDPFDDAYLGAHDNMYMMIQLIEFLISDYGHIWTAREDFDWRLLEEWLRSILQARKSLGLLENRNGLYTLYIERVIGELAKRLGPLQQEGSFLSDILSNLYS